jgi:SanA protein
MKKYLPKIKILIVLGLIVLAFIVWANLSIKYTSKEFITDDVSQLKEQKVGLLLGTSKTLKNGSPNAFFQNRIDAAVELFHQQKIEYIIVSGDNRKKDYNEPLDMKNELVKRGIPENKIYLDYAGFRTLDSVIRAKEIFGQTSFIIISQKFHNERAVFLARKNGVDAYGYNAKEVLAYSGFKTKLREVFARVKVFVDIAIHKKPKFLGEKIIIE